MIKRLKLICLIIMLWCMVPGYSSAIEVTWDPEMLLRAYIKENYPWTEVEIDNLTFPIKVPDSAPIRIIIEKGPPGRTVFVMEFASGQKVKATAEVKVLDWIVMTARSFKKGHQIHEGDVYMKLADATRIPSGAIRSIDLAIGKLLTRSLIANTPLLSDMVSAKPMVKKGQKVTLLVDTPHFRITAPGEMREGSYIGSYVKVINLASKKPVIGLLLDESTVKVEF